MTDLLLTHDFTPDQLKSINDQICSLISEQNIDDVSLRDLVSQRDDFIQHYLTELDVSQKERFVRSETQSNDALLLFVKAQLSDSLGQLSGLLRGRKAVNKYK